MVPHHAKVSDRLAEAGNGLRRGESPSHLAQRRGRDSPAMIRIPRLLSAVIFSAAALASAQAPPEGEGRAQLLAEIHRTREEIERHHEGSIDRYAEPEYAREVGRFWALAERWTSEYLDAHPAASTREIEADLATLANDLRPSAVRLTGEAVAVSIEWAPHGIVFVVSRTPRHPFAVTWDIRAPAGKGPSRADLAAWAYVVPGIHRGPLGGRILALPPARSGRPRFLVEAIQHAALGLEVPGQISVWEWTGSEVILKFIRGYVTTLGASGAKLQGDRLRVPTKEATRMFYTCGSCEEPQGAWTLRITPEGVTDFGHAFDEPLLKLTDDLLDRVAHHQDASSLASAKARARLAEILADAREPEEPEDNLGLGMLMDWKVRVRGDHRLVELLTDRVHLLLTIRQRSGRAYVTAVEVPASAEGD